MAVGGSRAGTVTPLGNAGCLWGAACPAVPAHVPGTALGCTSPSTGPSILEGWKELGDIAMEWRAWPSGKTRPCEFTRLQSNSYYCRKLNVRNVLSPAKKDLPR